MDQTSSATVQGNDRVNLKEQFARVACINLDRRFDRWEEFKSRLPIDWPFLLPERFQAVDGKLCRHPTWWSAGGGAWGCYRSHLKLLEECLNNNIPSCLFLEDDAYCVEGFIPKCQQFFQALPSNWGMVYLGGQHLGAKANPPLQINDYVFRPYNVNRTHAFGIRGREMMLTVYRHLTTKEWQPKHHIDHHLGRLHQKRENPIFTPWEWLMGQAEGKSNVSNKSVPDRLWAPADHLQNHKGKPFVLVLGTHSSGSSCIAMVLDRLGVHMGNSLGGYYGGEAKGLVDICEWAVPFPTKILKRPPKKIQKRLTHWINARRREAAEKRTIAGGKYPSLCLLADMVKQGIGKANLLVIDCDRPIVESIESLHRRTEVDIAKLGPLQILLYQAKREFLQSNPEIRNLTVNYASTLGSPHQAVQRIVDFLSIETTDEQIEEAINLIDPSKRHVQSHT